MAMCKLLLILTIFFCLKGEGQTPMSKLLMKRANVAYDYLLDTYTGSAAAYSLRLLKSDYAGSSIRVRESGGDTETDIGFVNNVLDTATLKTFCGSNSGYIVTWYDQSGNGRDLAQATQAEQPRIMDNGVIDRLNGDPTVYFDGDNDYVSRAVFLNSFSAATCYLVTAVVSDPPTGDPTSGAWVETGSDFNTHTPYLDGNIYDGFATTSRKPTGNPSTSMTSIFLYSAISAASDWRSYINNTLHFSTTTNTYGGNTVFKVGESTSAGVYNYNGRITELIFYGSASSDSDRSGISGNINTFYTIY